MTRNTVPAKKSTQVKNEPISVIILNANDTQRMKYYGPRPLLKIGQVSLIEKQINVIKSIYKNSEIIVVLGNEEKKIRKHIKSKCLPVRLVYNPHYQEFNSAYSTKLGIYNTSSHINKTLILHGDLLFNKTAIEKITYNKSVMLIGGDAFKDREIGLICDTDDYVTHLSYGLPVKWGQVIYLEEGALDTFEKIVMGCNENWFLYQAINELLEKRIKIKIHRPKDMILVEIDNKRDLEEAYQYENSV